MRVFLKYIEYLEESPGTDAILLIQVCDHFPSLVDKDELLLVVLGRVRVSELLEV